MCLCLALTLGPWDWNDSPRTHSTTWAPNLDCSSLFTDGFSKRVIAQG
jgi:hypothetical protein